MERKNLRNRVLAAILAGTMGLPLAACEEKKILEEYEKEKQEVYGDFDEKLEQQKDEIVKSILDELQGTTMPETTTSTTSTEYTQTFTTAQPTELITTEQIIGTTEQTTEQTTSTTEQTTSTTEQTTTTTTTSTVEKNELDISNITMDGFEKQINDYEIVDGNYEVTINDEFPTLWSIAYKYHPSNVSTVDFIEQIKELNNKKDNFIFKGEKLKVPARLVYYTSKSCVLLVSNITGTTVKEICKLNNLPIEENFKYEKDGNESRKLLIKVLPSNTEKYITNNGITASIYGNTIVYAQEIIPFGKTYKMNETQSNQFVNSAFTISTSDEYPYNNEFYLNQFKQDGSSSMAYFGNNINKIYIVNNIPVFETRSVQKCKEIAATTGYDYTSYMTQIATFAPSAYHFYKDKNGNTIFTFENEDLTKYGFTKADEEAKKYIPTLNDLDYSEPTKTK